MKERSHVLFLLIFLLLFSYYGVRAWQTLPAEGDSLAYHIPIAESVLSGDIFFPLFPLGFYPGNAELLLAVMIAISLPLNIFNVFGTIVLYIVLILLGRRLGLETKTSIVYAFAVCSLYIIQRWVFTQVIDVWFAVFYAGCLYLLHRPQNKKLYFFLLGTMFGLLFGSKFSGPVFFIILLGFYIHRLKDILSFRNILFFMIPFSLLGFSWYLRNFILTGNPMYPQRLFFLEGQRGWNILETKVIHAIIYEPVLFFNAITSEYLAWWLGIVVLLFYLRKNSLQTSDVLLQIILLTFCNFFVFLFLPTTYVYNIIVSSFRYSLPFIITLLLSMFLISQRYKFTTLLAAYTMLNFIITIVHPYRPKIMYFIFALFIALYFISKKHAVMKI